MNTGLNESSLVTSQGVGTNYTGGLYADNCYYPYPDWYNHYHYHYPQPQTYITVGENKTELAFKIASKLIEEKIIEKITVKGLIELVNKIAKLI